MSSPFCLSRTVRRFYNGLMRFRLSLTLLLGCVLSQPLLIAQQAALAISPQVQQLYDEARQAQNAGDTAGAVERYRQILHLAPRLAPAYNNLGMLLYNDGEYGQAAETLRKGLAIDPRMKSAQTLLGLSEYRSGHLSEAAADLKKALAADPGNSDAELTLARIEITTGEATAGTGRLQNYLKRNPKDQATWYLLGKTYLQLSEDALGRITEIDADSMTAHLIAGEVDESMRNYDGALGEYSKAVEKGPNQPGTHYHLGNAFWLQAKWESAEAEFRAELKNDPNNCVTQWKLGNSILAQNKAAAEALPFLDAAVSGCPNLTQARVDHANALLKTDQPQRALDDLTIAVKSSPSEPSIYYAMSRAYKATGKDQQARASLETYGRLQREANERSAQQARDVLNVKEQAH